MSVDITYLISLNDYIGVMTDDQQKLLLNGYIFDNTEIDDMERKLKHRNVEIKSLQDKLLKNQKGWNNMIITRRR